MTSEDRSLERVLFTPELEIFGGAERTCFALLEWLYEHQIPFRYLCYEDRMGISKYAPVPIPVTEIRPVMKPISKIRALRDYFSRNPLRYKPLMSGIQAASHASAAGLKGFHVLMHDTPSLIGQENPNKSTTERLRRRAHQMLLRRGLATGGRTIVSSYFLSEESKTLFGGDVVVAPMGGKSRIEQAVPRVVGSELRFLSVARVEANKRIDWILKALAQLESAHPPLSARIPWSFDVVGDGSMLPALRQMAADLGIAARVRFHGFVSNEQLEEIYDSSHLFLVPARQGFGLPALEAIDRGMPVLIHRESGASDLLLETPWAVVFTGGPEALVPALETAINSVREGRHVHAPVPPHPSEKDWAEQVARYCNWI